MRIQSKFVDYYDCQQKYADFDAKPLIRNMFSDEINIDLKHNVFGWHETNIHVGFCGIIYPGIHSHRIKDFREESYSYSSEQFLNRTTNAINNTREFKRKVDGYFSPTQNDELFIKYNCPAFIIIPNYDKTFTIYCHTMNRGNTNNILKLSDISFDSLIPANIAYMNIESYMYNVLFKEHKEIPEISNKDKILLGGFDNNSFKH